VVLLILKIADVMRELELKLLNSFIKILESYEGGNPLPYKNLKLYMESYEMNILTDQKYYEFVWDNL